MEQAKKSRRVKKKEIYLYALGALDELSHAYSAGRAFQLSTGARIAQRAANDLDAVRKALIRILWEYYGDYFEDDARVEDVTDASRGVELC